MPSGLLKIRGGKAGHFFLPGGDQRGGTLKKSGAPNLEEDGRMRERKKGGGGRGRNPSARTLIVRGLILDLV